MAGIETVTFKAGSVIFKEGEKADAVYFLESGTVEVSKNDRGTKVILAKLGKDAVFGEMALIDKKPRSATVTAIENITCLKGNEAAFSGLIAKADGIVKEVMTKLVTCVREKNNYQKAQMSQSDITSANAIKQRNDKLKTDILANQAIQGKLSAMDPFLGGLYNSLITMM